jgi:hypothetical protein
LITRRPHIVVRCRPRHRWQGDEVISADVFLETIPDNGSAGFDDRRQQKFVDNTADLDDYQ